ncbi:MAG: oligosaccharide flippase family protein, partial [Prevotella sp.]|nr:oligosaccharide flippase family protein [Prevotella sp.]
MRNNQKENSLKDKTAKGLFWGGLSNGVQQLLGLLFGIILGRLLSPTDYGMIAMIAVFSLIANELQNSGFRAALVNIKEPTHKDYNSVFWFNILMGGTLYAILFFCAPLIADYYNTPELTPLSRYAFLGFVFSSFCTAQTAFLHKNLKAKQMAKAGMTAVMVSSCVGVIMAWKGCSYWSLATQTNLYILINTLLMWHYSSWRPSFDFDFGPVRRMF